MAELSLNLAANFVDKVTGPMRRMGDVSGLVLDSRCRMNAKIKDVGNNQRALQTFGKMRTSVRGLSSEIPRFRRQVATLSEEQLNLTRFHGIFSSNSKLREHVVPEKPIEKQENSKPKAYSMTWAQRLKRMFAIEIEKCEKCGGPVRIIASLKDPDVVQKILKHLGLDQREDPQNRAPPADLTDQQTTLL